MESFPSGWLWLVRQAVRIFSGLIPRRRRPQPLKRVEWHERDGLFRTRKIVVEIYSLPKREE